MAFLENMVEQLLGGANVGASSSEPLRGLLSSLFRGVPGGMNNTGVSGLGGLINRFDAAGLGDVARSWVSQGPNMAVAPEQLRHVLGEDQVTDLARQSGLEPGDVLGQLAQLLPDLVDRMTPEGRLPGDHGPASEVRNPFGSGEGA